MSPFGAALACSVHAAVIYWSWRLLHADADQIERARPSRRLRNKGKILSLAGGLHALEVAQYVAFDLAGCLGHRFARRQLSRHVEHYKCLQLNCRIG